MMLYKNCTITQYSVGGAELRYYFVKLFFSIRHTLRRVHLFKLLLPQNSVAYQIGNNSSEDRQHSVLCKPELVSSGKNVILTTVIVSSLTITSGMIRHYNLLKLLLLLSISSLCLALGMKYLYETGRVHKTIREYSSDNILAKVSELVYENSPGSLRSVSTEGMFGGGGTDKEFDMSVPPFSEFALYVRMFYRKKNLYNTMLVQSMYYFWFLKIPIVAVLDKTEKDKEFGEEIKNKFPYPEIQYEKPFPNKWRISGYSLQQWSMLHADNTFNRTYVGFIDTDALFVTTVTPQLIFEDGKPIVIGQFGKPKKGFWSTAARSTEYILKKKEVYQCMSYFPVVMKVSHIAEMRKYVAQIHGKDFDDVYRFIASKPHSQFSIMCNYVWYFHRDEYKFRAQLRHNDGVWRGTSPSREDKIYYDENVDENMRKPIVRSSIHYRYTSDAVLMETFRRMFKDGFCFSGGFDWCPNVCNARKKMLLRRDLFVFEWSDWSWDKRCIDAQKEHYKNVSKMITPSIRNRIIEGCKVVNSLTFKL